MYNKNTCYSPALGKPPKKEQTCSFYAMEPNTSFLVCGANYVYMSNQSYPCESKAPNSSTSSRKDVCGRWLSILCSPAGNGIN